MADALDALPDEIGGLMDNVAVVVDGRPPRADLLGLYEGIPLTERDDAYGCMAMPDRITIFRRADLRRVPRPRTRSSREVRITVVHEVGHHFGIDDDRARTSSAGAERSQRR